MLFVLHFIISVQFIAKKDIIYSSWRPDVNSICSNNMNVKDCKYVMQCRSN